LPVKPCTITRESLLTSMLIVFMLRENNTEAPKFNKGCDYFSVVKAMKELIFLGECFCF